jgi:methionyl aminopeptidase
MISRNDPCWCGSNKKWKKCHYPELPKVSFEKIKEYYLKQYGIIVKNFEQIEKIKIASKVAASILDEICHLVKVNMTTQDIDDICMDLHKQKGAIPAPLGYGEPPYPKSVCTSLNDVICHGIPDSKTVLKDGDFLNIDVTSIVNGYYGDCSRMVAIGEISEEKKRVMQTSYDCLIKSIEICKPGTKIYEIGDVIEKEAKKNDCSVVNMFVGHGVGVYFHEPPQILHHYNNIQIPLVPGMIFTIEPMINAGDREGYIDKKDKWTARTIDKKPSAQWEHTILITETSHEILTTI